MTVSGPKARQKKESLRQVTPSPRLFQVKLRPPSVRGDMLARTALQEHERLRGARLVLVNAPAGFGKTTAICQYEQAVRAANVFTAWLTLDTEDNDPARFGAYLSAALAPYIASATAPLGVDSPGGSGAAIGDALDLIDSLAATDRPLALFLDDFEHVSDNPDVRSVVSRLLHTLGPGQQLVIGTRSVPDLSLARLRARGQVIDIGPDRLRFSFDESRRFVHESGIAGMSNEDLALLHDRTEGWPAALQFAVLALRDSPQAARRLREFGGSRAEVAEYFAAEVLTGLEAELRRFAIRTSVLDHFCAELCEAVTGFAGGAAFIERMGRANLFLVPLDAERRWFRYHALYREFLRAELGRAQASLIPDLHRRAARWLTANGRQADAVEHALRADDPDLAMEVLGECAHGLMHDGQIATLLRWTDAIGVERLGARPALYFVTALVNVVSHRYGEARRLIDAISAGSDAEPAHQRRELIAVRYNLAIWSDDLQDLHELLDQAVAVFTAADGFVYPSMLNCVGYLGLLECDTKKARANLSAAKAAPHHRENEVVRTYTEGETAMVHLVAGELHDARLVANTELDRLAIAGSCYGTPAAIVAMALADAHYERDEIATARMLLDEHLDVAANSCIPDLIITGFVVRSRIARIEGLSDAADDFLGRLQRLGEERGQPRMVATALFEKSRIALAEGRLETAETHAREAVAYPFWKLPIFRGAFGNDLENPEISLARLELFHGGTGALASLETQVSAAVAAGRKRRALKLRGLRAQALWVSGQRQPALRELRRVLLDAAPEGLVRVLADEPWVLHDMLGNLSGDEAVSAFGKRVAQACGPPRSALGSAFGATPDATTSAAQVLSDREIEVLETVARGLSNKQIASELCRSVATVATHLRRINGKLGARTRTQAMAIARRAGLIS